MTILLNDIKYACRQFGKSPGFTVAVILIFSLGIAANTAVFSVVNAVVLKSLPYRNADRIVTLWEQTRWGPRSPSYEVFITWYRQSRVFEDVAACGTMRLYVSGIDKSREVLAGVVSPNLLPLLGVEPLPGRVFLPEEEQAGHICVVVLSHRFWTDRLGADPNALGRTMSLTATT